MVSYLSSNRLFVLGIMTTNSVLDLFNFRLRTSLQSTDTFEMELSLYDSTRLFTFWR